MSRRKLKSREWNVHLGRFARIVEPFTLIFSFDPSTGRGLTICGSGSAKLSEACIEKKQERASSQLSKGERQATRAVPLKERNKENAPHHLIPPRISLQVSNIRPCTLVALSVLPFSTSSLSPLSALRHSCVELQLVPCLSPALTKTLFRHPCCS
jgi:hypothetical protein